MDVQLETKIDTDTIILLIVGIMLAGVFIVAMSKLAKTV